ncbi:unnamed protein product [Prorocentrum cordatum]|nr:unnamed protein product [Polarella glacialis]
MRLPQEAEQLKVENVTKALQRHRATLEQQFALPRFQADSNPGGGALVQAPAQVSSQLPSPTKRGARISKSAAVKGSPAEEQGHAGRRTRQRRSAWVDVARAAAGGSGPAPMAGGGRQEFYNFLSTTVIEIMQCLAEGQDGSGRGFPRFGSACRAVVRVAVAAAVLAPTVGPRKGVAMQKIVAAFEGLGTRSTSTTTTSERPCLVDAKGTGKPQPLRGDSWSSFCFKCMSFITSMYPTARDLHERAQSHEDAIRGIDGAKIDPDADRAQDQLHTVLAQLVEGESEEIVRNCESQKVLNQPEQKLEKLSSAIEARAQDITRYQQRAKKTVDDDIKTAVLIPMCPNPLKQHLQLNDDRFDFYDDVLDGATQCAETRRASQLDEPTPMDIGSLQKGACKGKNKGMGKGYCGKCWEVGHVAKGCKSGEGRDSDSRPRGARGKQGRASKGCRRAITGKASKGAPRGDKGCKTKRGGKKGLHCMGAPRDYEDQPGPEVGGLELCAVERAEQGAGPLDDIFLAALESLGSVFSGVGDSAPEPLADCAGAPVKREGLEGLGLYSAKYDQDHEAIDAAADSAAAAAIAPEEMRSDHPIDPDGSGIEHKAAGGQTSTDKEGSYAGHVGAKQRAFLNRANRIFLVKLRAKSAPKQQCAEAATNPMEIDRMIAALQKQESTGGAEASAGSAVESKVAEPMGFSQQV